MKKKGKKCKDKEARKKERQNERQKKKKERKKKENQNKDGTMGHVDDHQFVLTVKHVCVYAASKMR